MTVNGWSNHETWAANLWLNNDEATYKKLNDEIRRVITEDTTEEEVAKFFRHFASDNLSSHAIMDIGAWEMVNWKEIGYHWIDEVEL